MIESGFASHLYFFSFHFAICIDQCVYGIYHHESFAANIFSANTVKYTLSGRSSRKRRKATATIPKHYDGLARRRRSISGTSGSYTKWSVVDTGTTVRSTSISRKVPDDNEFTSTRQSSNGRSCGGRSVGALSELEKQREGHSKNVPEPWVIDEE
jgi:hypothetical protein